MAAKEEEYPLETPQEHALMCEKHALMPIDVTCEDCEKFICSKCVKEDHKDHDWITIPTAATLRTRGLLKAMTKIEEEDIKQIDEKIQEASRQIDENKKKCETEIKRIQRHNDAILEKLEKMKHRHENSLRDSLESKNNNVSKVRSSLEERKKKVMQRVKSLKENSGAMTDIILLKTHRELMKLLLADTNSIEKYGFLLRHEGGNINEAVLESMMGQTFDAEQITATETDSFQWSDKPIVVIEAMNEDTCLLAGNESPFVAQVNKSGKKEKQFSIDVNDVCVTDNNEVYVTDEKNKSISRLSLSGSVSPVFSTDPLVPIEICQTKDGGLLVTLKDTESDIHVYKPNSDSRRLVRHVTLTGDVIREYEYQEDGQTRLFTLPGRVTQNGNTDICAINMKSETCSELVILSFSGSLKTVYPEQNQRKELSLADVVCDSYSNIIVCELSNSSVHLLSPDGEFMRYLLTKNQVNRPYSMSMKKSTLWIADFQGRVKVFQYNLN
uniref:Uncharacterized protein LOC111132723 n=1 Tax=Crassostrea virginica TaxID=6565 RepID=A0A8B8E7Z5_CRAVI|nr:uncharacterized protein LOC111132723 [Crassostrea virginica]